MFSRYRRLAEVSFRVVWFAAQSLIYYVLLRRGPAELGRLAGLHLRDLGGGYIKLAQALALRYDIFPERFCVELAQAQDDAPPFDYRQAREIIETELGRPADELFFCLDKSPTGADSFAQRYCGVLKTGESVVVKVRRPGAKQLAEADLHGIRFLLKVIDFSGLLGRVSLSRDYQAFRDRLLEGLSFLAEAGRVERFAAQSRDNPGEYVPQVYWSHTTDAVLTLERLEGVLLSDVMYVIASSPEPLTISSESEVEGVNLHQAAKNIAHNFLNHLFDGRYFLRDPRPADLIIMEDNVIGYLDFGSMRRMDHKFTRYRLDFLYAARVRDLDALYEVVLEYFEPPLDADLAALEDVFKSRVSEWLEACDDEYSSDEERSFLALLMRCMDGFRRLQVPVPGMILDCYQAFASVGGVTLKIAPGLDLQAEWGEFFRAALTRRVQRQMKFDTLSEVFLEYEAFVLGLPRHFRESMRLMRRSHYPVVRMASPRGLRGWKLMHVLASSLFLGLLAARVWAYVYPTARTRELFALLPPAAFWGALAVLLVLRRIFKIRYEYAAQGHYRMRRP